MRRIGTHFVSLEEEAATIADQIEVNNDLMQNDPISELYRTEMLRGMSQGLNVKRLVRAKLSSSLNVGKSKDIGFWRLLRFRISIYLMKV